MFANISKNAEGDAAEGTAADASDGGDAGDVALDEEEDDEESEEEEWKEGTVAAEDIDTGRACLGARTFKSSKQITSDDLPRAKTSSISEIMSAGLLGATREGNSGLLPGRDPGMDARGMTTVTTDAGAGTGARAGTSCGGKGLAAGTCGCAIGMVTAGRPTEAGLAEHHHSDRPHERSSEWVSE
jgi:hypothetical protein